MYCKSVIGSCRSEIVYCKSVIVEISGRERGRAGTQPVYTQIGAIHPDNCITPGKLILERLWSVSVRVLFWPIRLTMFERCVY